jgi:hypothetical protein
MARLNAAARQLIESAVLGTKITVEQIGGMGNWTD